MSMLMWWKSAVNRYFFLSLATFRMRSSACDTLTRLCARHVLCWSAFPLVSALGSTGSAVVGSAADCSTAGRATLFTGFAATMTESDFSCPCIIGYGSSPSRCGPPYSAPLDDGGQTRDIPGSGCGPFARDVAFDPGRASAPRMAVPHMLPSHIEADCSGSLPVDEQLEFGRLHDWEVGRLGSLQDFARVDADLAKHVHNICSVAHQAARFDIF